MEDCSVCYSKTDSEKDRERVLFEETFIQPSDSFLKSNSIKPVAFPCGPRDRQETAERYRHMWKKGIFIDLIIQTRNSTER